MSPDRAKGYDVSDWFDAGGTADELRRIIADSPVWTPEPSAAPEVPLPTGPRLVVRSLADVQAKPIDWLWDRWLARGKLHILGGHPGDGKSTVAAALAAYCSIAGRLPDGSPAPLLRWLFLLAEDALDDTFRPRLAHVADPGNVFAIEAVREPDGRDRLFSLIDHLPLLEAAIRDHAIDAVVVDPLTSFMPRSDRNGEGDVRDALTPLGKLAERLGVAVLAIMHVGKPAGAQRRPLQQLLGATAFGAIARIVWMVAPCPDDDTGARRVLGVVKSNLAMKPAALEWSRLDDQPIAWHGASDHRLDDLLTASPATPRADAAGFLRETLKGGSIPATEVLALAAAAGISERTLRRAADGLKVERFKLPGRAHGPWMWKLPNSAKVATSATDGDRRVEGLDGRAQLAAPNWYEGRRAKMATALDDHLATLLSPHVEGKLATSRVDGQVAGAGQGGQDVRLAASSDGHLDDPTAVRRVCAECGDGIDDDVPGFYCVLHGGRRSSASIGRDQEQAVNSPSLDTLDPVLDAIPDGLAPGMSQRGRESE